ncbi:MAG TPA: VOC family protein [Spirochaetota bacterium]
MIRQLAHVCFYTDKMEEMRRFYTDTLGLRFHFAMKNPEGKTFGVYLSAGANTFIEIFDRAGAQAMWGGDDKRIERGTSIKHLCFEVSGLDEYRNHLLSKGLSVTEPRGGMEGARQAWTADPDGTPIELMEYNFQSWQLRAPQEEEKRN